MTTLDTLPATAHEPAVAPADTAVEADGRNMLAGWRERSAARKRRRLAGARNRAIHARWLRRTANRANNPNPIPRHREALLQYRAAAARANLPELARKDRKSVV